MKKIYMITWMFGMILLVVACQSGETVASYINIEATEKLLNKEKEVSKYPDVGDANVFDFAYINGALKTEEDHEVSEVIKIYASSWTIDKLHYPIAIDIENNEIYVEPSIKRNGVQSETDRKKVDDIHKVQELIETYDVLNWQNYYSDVKDYHSYEDGASWSLVVQYADGSIEEFRGRGVQHITPDNYDDFMHALGKYVVGHLDD